MGILDEYIQAARGAVNRYGNRVDRDAELKLALISKFMADPGQYFVDSATKWPPIDEAKKYDANELMPRIRY